MPTRIYQAYEVNNYSNGGQDKDGAAIIYHAQGYANEQEAVNAVLDNTPTVYADLARDFARATGRTTTPDGWMVEVTFVAPKVKGGQGQATFNLPEGEELYSFDTTGRTQTIYNYIDGDLNVRTELSNLAKTKPGSKKVVFEGGEIAMTEDGPEGVDVVVPGLKFTITRAWNHADINLDFIRRIAGMTGKVNDGDFLGFTAAELLFLGATGSQQTDGDLNVLYHFEARATIDNFTYGDVEFNTTKVGWEYPWGYYIQDTVDDEDDEEADTSKILWQASYGPIYEMGDFTQLGLYPTPPGTP